MNSEKLRSGQLRMAAILYMPYLFLHDLSQDYADSAAQLNSLLPSGNSTTKKVRSATAQLVFSPENLEQQLRENKKL